MKNTILGFIILSIVCVSCKKEVTCNRIDSTVTASAAETTSVENYLTTAGITGAQKHPSGFYYKINQAGTGKAIINLCSLISVKYTGKLTNGTVFDPSTPGAPPSAATFELGGVITGWQKGLPLISSGGKITLFIPPSLGYGSTATGPIPANSILIFDIELISVN